jgi:hypothetical protein
VQKFPGQVHARSITRKPGRGKGPIFAFAKKSFFP